MPNTNRNMVQDSENKIRNKAIKKYHEENRFDLKYLFLMLCYVVVFFLLSIATDSTFFSLILAIFSFITTFSFEALEWMDFKSESISSRLATYILKNKTIVMLIIPILFIITMIPLYIWNKIDADLYKQTMQNIDSHIPNIVTSITFALYFISFYIRSYFKKREAFITSFNKKFHHPYN